MGRLHEDVYITYKLLDRAQKFVYLDAPYYFYYQKNNNSISNNYGKKNFLDEYNCIQQIQHYFALRNDIYDYVLVFSSYHYLFMLYRIGKQHDKDIQTIKKAIKKWLFRNIPKLKLLSFSKRIKLYAGAISPKFYMHMRRIKSKSKKDI